jgi:hypothetical protein
MMEHTKEYIYNNESYIPYKDPILKESKIASEYGEKYKWS